MGQILHGSAKTTHAVRAAIQRSKASIKELAGRYDLNPKTVTKWRKRPFVHDAAMGPKAPHSTVLSAEEEALAVAFRKHTLLPLDDCLYALQATIPHLTRSSLHRLFQRHSISRLPAIEGETKQQKAFKHYPIGYFHIDIAEVRTGEGKLHLFVAIDRTSKFAFAQLHEQANRNTATAFLKDLIAVVPYTIHTVLTDNGIQFCDLPKNRSGSDGQVANPYVRSALSRARDRASDDKAKPSVDQRASRADEPHPQGGDHPALSLRQPRPASPTPRRIPRRLQFWQTPQDPQRPHAVRIRLRGLDQRAGSLQT